MDQGERQDRSLTDATARGILWAEQHAKNSELYLNLDNTRYLTFLSSSLDTIKSHTHKL